MSDISNNIILDLNKNIDDILKKQFEKIEYEKRQYEVCFKLAAIDDNGNRVRSKKNR